MVSKSDLEIKGDRTVPPHQHHPIASISTHEIPRMVSTKSAGDSTYDRIEERTIELAVRIEKVPAFGPCVRVQAS